MASTLSSSGTMSSSSSFLPIGIRFCGSFKCLASSNNNTNGKRITAYRMSIIVLTFLAYSSYHLSRRPLSVVKNVLSRNCSKLIPPSGASSINETWCDWEPFAGDEANTLLGLLDSSFLFAYAFFMFFSGFIAERCHLRYFLSIGMLMSGIFTYLFGIAFYYNIHSIYYFIVIQFICGNN